MCTYDSFQSRHIRKFLYYAKKIQRIFKNVYSQLFLKIYTQKMFETNKKLQRIFQECIQDYSSKKLLLWKSFKRHQGKISIFFSSKKSWESSKTCFFKKKFEIKKLITCRDHYSKQLQGTKSQLKLSGRN